VENISVYDQSDHSSRNDKKINLYTIFAVIVVYLSTTSAPSRPRQVNSNRRCRNAGLSAYDVSRCGVDDGDLQVYFSAWIFRSSVVYANRIHGHSPRSSSVQLAVGKATSSDGGLGDRWPWSSLPLGTDADVIPRSLLRWPVKAFTPATLHTTQCSHLAAAHKRQKQRETEYVTCL